MPFTSEVLALLWNKVAVRIRFYFSLFSFQLHEDKGHTFCSTPSIKKYKASHTYTCTTSRICIHQPCTGEEFSFFLKTEPLLLWPLINPEKAYLCILCVFFRGACLLSLDWTRSARNFREVFLQSFFPLVQFPQIAHKTVHKIIRNTLQQFIAEFCYFLHILQWSWPYLSPAYAYAHTYVHRRESKSFNPC